MTTLLTLLSSYLFLTFKGIKEIFLFIELIWLLFFFFLNSINSQINDSNIFLFLFLSLAFATCEVVIFGLILNKSK